jgi:ornithine cyclodeaminase/alanine dehydrogenase-like protein (mu-crystallin family)
VVGAGVNGRAAARTFVTRGRAVKVWDVNGSRAEQVARELGCGVASSLEEALADDIVVTVTPGHEVLFASGSLRAGQHLSLMGADGPGKAEVASSELERSHLFCDDWEQASHGGELAHAVEAGLVAQTDVTQIGDVLAGTAGGRAGDHEVTAFDSTGLAIQDLAIALAALERADELPDLARLEL